MTDTSHFEEDTPMTNLKGLPLKLLKLAGILSVIALILFNCYEFGYKKWEAKIYAKGVEAGKTEINQMVIQNLVQQGRIGINIPIGENGQYSPDGQVKTIYLVPQISQ